MAKEKTIAESFVPLLIGIIIAVAAFYLGRQSMDNSFNPRMFNDTIIYYKDTGYKVRLYIDTVFEIDEDNKHL